MPIDVLVTARIRVDRDAELPSREDCDLALQVASVALRDELPHGVTFQERTARIVAITPPGSRERAQ